MLVKTPMIGMPQLYWHKKTWKYAKQNPNFIKMDISNFGYDCSRHLEFLKFIDDPSKDVRESEYWRYSKKTRGDDSILSKIEIYKQTYHRIKSNGFTASGDKYNSSIIVTDDGCRLDGSHRVSILLHMGILEVDVNVVVYEDVFSKKESKKIRKNNLKYRKEKYGME